MKIIHFSDTHVGIESRGSIDQETSINVRTLDILDGIDAMIDLAIEENVDVALFAGDAFHRHSPPQNYVNEFGKRILRLSKQCPVVLLVGNHDIPGVTRASALEIYKTLEVDNVTVGRNCELLKINTKSGVLQVVTVPYPSKAWLSLKELKISESIQDLLKKEVANRIKKLSKDIDKSLPAVLLGHFTAEGSQYSSERTMLVSSSESNVSLEELTLPVWDYVALGHIHKHQDISNGIKGVPPIVYAGSMDRIDFGEEKDPKGFVLVTIENKQTVWEFVDVNARPFKTLEYSLSGKNITNKILEKIGAKNLEGAVVRVIITPEDELSRLSLDENAVRDCLINDKKVFLINSFTIRRTEESIRSVRGMEINSSMTPAELLTSYLQQQGHKGKALNKLLDEFSKISTTCEVEND